MSSNLKDSVEKLHELFDSTDLEVEARKIELKMNEARYNPGDVRPLADCIFSILMAARNRGYRPDMVFAELDKIAEEALRCEWKKMPDGTYQSIDTNG